MTKCALFLQRNQPEVQKAEKILSEKSMSLAKGAEQVLQAHQVYTWLNIE